MENENKKKLQDRSPYFKVGLAIFLAGLLLILSFYIINEMDTIKSGIAKVNGILSPFYVAFIMAFLLCPFFNFVTKKFYNLFIKRMKTLNALKVSKLIATILSVILIFVIIGGLIVLIIPELINTLSQIIPKIEPAFTKAANWITHVIENYPTLLKNYPDVVDMVSDKLDSLSGNLVTFVTQKVLPKATNFVVVLSSGVVGTVKAIVNFFIALISCVYFLNGKETFLAQFKKIIYSIFSKDTSLKIFEFGSIANTQFSGFINGKALSSVIVGSVCFLCMLVMKIPYAVLISVIVGVTNIIPFFGPFIGAIPSALILLLEDPKGCLEFVIMIIILQQLDGNLITPTICGKTNKLGSFWVMFAIIVGGGFLGFLGMIIGVPVFAIIYTYIARFVDNKLIKKDMASDTLTYEEYSKYETGDAIKMSKRERERESSKKEAKKLSDDLKRIFSKNDK